MSNIEKYVDSIIRKIDISKEERQEYRLQFIDHINSLKEEYMRKGLLEGEASKHAIKDFGSERQILDTQELNEDLKNSTKLTLTGILLIYIFILFGHYIKLAGAEGNAGNLVALKSLIPTRTIFGMVHGIAIHGFNSWYNDLLITYIILFIPVGILVPFIFTKFKSLSQNMKLFITIALGIQFIKLIFLSKVINTDFALMNIFGCIIGYKIYRLIYIRLLRKIKYD